MSLVEPCLGLLGGCCRKSSKEDREWKKKLSTRDWQNLTKSIADIDLDGNGTLERNEMFEFVVKVYNSGLLTEKGDLKKQVTP